jgi:Ca2+-transporting ATPase
VFSGPIEGTTYKPVGEIPLFERNSEPEYQRGKSFKDFHPNCINKFTQCMAFNNESSIRVNPENPNQVVRTGLPTEAALKVLTEKIGTQYDTSFKGPNRGRNSSADRDLEAYNKHVKSNQDKIATLAFSRDRKRMSVLCTSDKT